MNSLSHPNQLPSVDKILQSEDFINLSECFGRDTVTSAVRAQLNILRQTLLKSQQDHTPKADLPAVIDYLHTEVTSQLDKVFSPSLTRVFNLTGTVLHTNLGRAPYPQSAIDAMVNISRGACNLEFDLEHGKRGRRDSHVEEWICELTGAEAATTVNNNAAAVLLTLNSIASNKNVIVSRGELIEIGGSFRVPAIMQKAGCKLREVGTTNRTHIHDYEEAISKKTAALMKVHTSNYEINGFTKSIDAPSLAELAHTHNIPLIDDLGSGTLTDLSVLGLPYERTARDAISDGVDIITFSGDKLLGGPQCGIIAGRKEFIRLIDKNPMKRALRLDKVTLAALEAVLKLYAKPEKLAENIPSLNLLSRDKQDINQTAQQLKSAIEHKLDPLNISVQPCQSQIGSGALPTRTLESYALVIEGNAEITATTLAEQLRSLPVPIIGRISQNSIWLDCRCLKGSNNPNKSDDLHEIIALINAGLKTATH